MKKVNGSDKAADILTKNVPIDLGSLLPSGQGRIWIGTRACSRVHLWPLSDEANAMDRWHIHFLVVLTKEE